MIMVRRNELACRNEWQRSLWTPRDGEPGDEPAFQRTSAMGPVAPATAEHVRALLAADVDSTSDGEGEDVLLSEARIVSEAPNEPQPVLAAARPRPLAVPAPGFDARSAVFRAREAYRDRIRARSVQERPSIRAQSVSPERAVPESVAVAGVADDPEMHAERTAQPEEPRVAAPRPAMPSSSGDDAQPARQAIAGARPPRAARQASIEPERERAEPEKPPVRPMENQEPRAAPADRGEPAICPAEPMELQSEAEPRAPNRRVQEEEELPAWFRTDLPRICRECRDFRPSADGQRGWCANAWAFTHRRLVHADDVAPCQSAIGDWWVPVDDVWLVAADVSSHGRPTPLLDRLVGGESPRRRRS